VRRSVVAALVVAVVVVAAAAALTAMRGRHDPAPVADIVLTRPGTARRSDLYLVALDDTPGRLLVRDATQPAASPDGLHVAFVRNQAIWVARRDGTGQTRVTRPGLAPRPKWQAAPSYDFAPAWSADGETLYFARGAPEAGSGIYSVRPDGTRLTALGSASGDGFPSGNAVRDPAPSPDGTLIAFADIGSHFCSGSIGAVATDGRVRELPVRLPELGPQLEPAWSPDGRRLAFTVDDHCAAATEQRQDESGLYVSRPDTSKALFLDLTGSSAAWSPDGGWIAYSGSGVVLVRADGTSAHRISEGSDPTWLLRP
jgi:Tol biopolymer transport system component